MIAGRNSCGKDVEVARVVGHGGRQRKRGMMGKDDQQPYPITHMIL